jgi:hypothetical protein
MPIHITRFSGPAPISTAPRALRDGAYALAVCALEQVRFDPDSLFGWDDCDPLAQDQAVQRPAEEFYDEDERR